MSPTPLVLDSGPLARLVHPKANADFLDWFTSALAADQSIVIPEIADYEVRRKLLHKDFQYSLARLDTLGQTLTFLPLDTRILRRAAELWALARRRGHPTAAPDSLDGDVILAAQTEAVQGTLITENVGDLSQFVTAKRWVEIRF